MFLRWGRRTPPEHIGKRAFVLYGLDRNRIHPLSLSLPYALSRSLVLLLAGGLVVLLQSDSLSLLVQ
jgi:hypothetical protein